MNRHEFRAALSELGLPFTGKLTSALLGVTGRQVQNMASGRCPVSRPVSRVLALAVLACRRGEPPAALAARLGLEWERPKRLRAISENHSDPGAP